MDANIFSPHALMNEISDPGENVVSLATMKQRIAILLVEEYVNYSQNRASANPFQCVKALPRTDNDDKCSVVADNHFFWRTRAVKVSVGCMPSKAVADNGPWWIHYLLMYCLSKGILM